MRSFSAAAVVTLCLLAQESLAGLPFHPQPTSSVSGEDLPKDGFTRLRLSLSSNDANSQSGIRLGQVAVCSESACYQANTPQTVSLKNSTQGLGTLVADIVVPLIEIRSVHFGSTTGQKSVLGDLKLQTSLKLEADYRGAEIAVVLEKTDQPGRQLYAPISAATNLWHPEGTRVYYNPKFATTANLPLGVTLHIPEKATESPHIFHLSVHKAGGAFPMIDIFPQVKLSKEATITMSRIERPQPADRQAKLETLDLVPPETGAAPRGNKNRKKKSFKVFDTGLINGD
ncbi:hypothetical protein [Eleftheria terrae]|uniref:hypothetical protein n=1 Tax=Eleftheria terrae TaxID=1597781 RepID=UPI00263BD855|nr:hypothetical protein [Eleftheria terrae]WKB52330.1 hypothetical protein N7L95_21440 [Eleftheria terrae]